MSTHLFKVELCAPVIVDDFGLCLDSLLSAAINEATDTRGEDNWSQLPIGYSELGDLKLRHASCVFFAGPTSFSRETFVRRRVRDEIGPEFFAGRRDQRTGRLLKNPWHIDQQRDEYKALLNTYRVVHAPALAWYVQTDDPDQIGDLLSSLHFIGKRRGDGYGELGLVEYRQLTGKDGESALFDADGLPRRPIPVEIWQTLRPHGQAAADVRVIPSRGYAPSAYENEPRLCAMPPSPFLKELAGIPAEDGEGDFFE